MSPIRRIHEFVIIIFEVGEHWFSFLAEVMNEVMLLSLLRRVFNESCVLKGRR